MITNKLVSIIIPCYNQAQYLAEAVKSVIEQTYSNIEIIIVNDGSPDNTDEIALGLQRKYPHYIKYINQNNTGVSEARNNGITKASGEYIFPLDADDKIDKEMINHCMQKIAENHADIIYTDLQCFDKSQRVILKRSFPGHHILHECIASVSALYRKEVWEVVQGYNSNMKEGYEDWEFWISAYEHGFRFQHLAEKLLYYRVKDISRNTLALQKDRYLKAKIRLNHPLLYTQNQIQNAINIIKENEKYVDLYFYYYSNIHKNIDDYIEESIRDLHHPPRNGEIKNIFDKTIAFYSLDIFTDSHSTQELSKKQEIDIVLYYTPIRYSIKELKSSNIAYKQDKGVVEVQGIVFPFFPKLKIEAVKIEILAYKHLIAYTYFRIIRKVKKTTKQIKFIKKPFFFPIKIKGKNTYSVISAVYNVEDYLNDYFQSIINQSLDFNKHIHLIIVDDGSTDSSAQIIKQWRSRYPTNITYIHKENGGQTSARNLGLAYVKTEWVTFIDPDDFVDKQYFEKVDDFIINSNDSQLAM